MCNFYHCKTNTISQKIMLRFRDFPLSNLGSTVCTQTGALPEINVITSTAMNTLCVWQCPQALASLALAQRVIVQPTMFSVFATSRLCPRTELSAACDWLNRLTWDPIDQSQAANTKYCELTQNSTDFPKVSMPNSNIYLCRVWRFTRGPGMGRSSPTRASSSRRWRRRTLATTPARPSTWRGRWSPRPSSWTSCVSGLKTEY